MTTSAICLSEVNESVADQELASLRAALDGQYIDASEAESVRDRIIESLRLAGLQYRSFRGSHNTESDHYGSADARWLAALARSLYARIPRDRRALRRGGKLKHISKKELEELDALHACSRPWRGEYYHDIVIGDARCAFAIGQRHDHRDIGTDVAELQAESDARFAEAAYKQMPTLLDELRRARKALSDLVAALYLDDNPRREAITRSQELLRQWEMLDD